VDNAVQRRLVLLLQPIDRSSAAWKLLAHRPLRAPPRRPLPSLQLRSVQHWVRFFVIRGVESSLPG
jgi:hypothetical protein